ncbi:hypothetical protein BJ508DRAFT_31521 [Ascobolus immersus RN42]|uniref:Uncharacterized protein n=1 Tax=Ascobolus immersus RN42 TaxID=1160509 RepID=A0A3N4IFZ0_ASCIM|nr:hypothetical protein BJ508DRAFT_31521 [Ascobolus immersus RN42]
MMTGRPPNGDPHGPDGRCRCVQSRENYGFLCTDCIAHKVRDEPSFRDGCCPCIRAELGAISRARYPSDGVLPDDNKDALYVLAEHFDKDEKISAYLQKWPALLSTNFKEGLLMCQRIWSFENRPVRLIGGAPPVLWRGYIDISIIRENNPVEGYIANASDPKSILKLYNFLKSLDTAEDPRPVLFIVVEDLSTWMISLLGAYLDVPPETFAQHLSNGGRRLFRSSLSTNSQIPNGSAVSLEGALPLRVESLASIAKLKRFEQSEDSRMTSIVNPFHIFLDKWAWKKTRSGDSSLRFCTTYPDILHDSEQNFKQNILRPFQVLNNSSGVLETKATFYETAKNDYIAFFDPRIQSLECPNPVGRCSTTAGAYCTHIPVPRDVFDYRYEETMFDYLCYDPEKIERCAEREAELRSTHDSDSASNDTIDASSPARSISKSKITHRDEEHNIHENIKASSQLRLFKKTVISAYMQRISSTSPRDAMDEVFRASKHRFLVHYLNSWNAALQMIGILLDGIGISVPDDVLITKRLQGWRNSLAEIEVFLATSKLRLDMMLNLDQEESSIKVLWKDCCSLLERTNTINQNVFSTMSIIESKEAITEAHAVSRLTELAFIFIPLSFASSFFGMEVKDWDSSKPTMSYFWLMSVCLLIGVYSFRLIIRSGKFEKAKSKLKADIFSRRHPDPDDPNHDQATLSTSEVLGYTYWKGKQASSSMAMIYCFSLTHGGWQLFLRAVLPKLLIFLGCSLLLLIPSALRPSSLLSCLLVVQGIGLFLASFPFLVLGFQLRIRKIHYHGVEGCPALLLWLGCIMAIILIGIPTTLIWTIGEENQEPRQILFAANAAVVLFATSRLTSWKAFCVPSFVVGAAYFAVLPALLLYCGEIPYSDSFAKPGVIVGLGFASLVVYSLLLFANAKLQLLFSRSFDPFQTKFFDEYTAHAPMTTDNGISIYTTALEVPSSLLRILQKIAYPKSARPTDPATKEHQVPARRTRRRYNQSYRYLPPGVRYASDVVSSTRSESAASGGQAPCPFRTGAERRGGVDP